ncbi:hypothetical protein HD554DRAFT_2143473 [Boletus coccyginus]|nr:hypothetical protein HD554DRAFT_2143473 [Boletus coccyginus]
MCSLLWPPPISVVVLPLARVMPPQTTVARASTLPSSPPSHLIDPLSVLTCPASATRPRSNLTRTSVFRKTAPQTTWRPRHNSRPSIVLPVRHSRRFPHSLDALGIVFKEPWQCPCVLCSIALAPSSYRKRDSLVGRTAHPRLSPIHKVHCSIQ